MIHRTASVVQCGGPVQEEAGGVAADQDRHGGGGLGGYSEVCRPQRVICNTRMMHEDSHTIIVLHNCEGRAVPKPNT